MIAHHLSHMLSLANAGTFPEKREIFYPFKSRVLRRYGRQDGYDKQIIQKKCFRCNGSGAYVSQCMACRYQGGCGNCQWDEEDFEETCYRHSNRCPKCGGSGWYVNKTVWLERWNFRGGVFHIPVELAESLPLLMEDPVNVFEGIIKHPHVDGGKAWHAALVLFAIYEIEILFRLSASGLKNSAIRPFRYVMNRWNEYRMGPIPF